MDDHELKFYEIPLKTHQFLDGVPLHSLDFIELKGGRRGMLMDEIYHITRLNQFEDFKAGLVTDTLFKLRTFLGKITGWDKVPDLQKQNSWVSRLTGEDRKKSLIPTGKVESVSTILYCYGNEILFEIINQTVHCFWVLAAEEKNNGYDLYVAVYVKKLNWRTPIYMTLISPMLKWIIYPAMKKSVQKHWEEEFSPKKILPKIELKV